MGDTDIYYFSGTGNSLYVARELQKRLPGAELIPMVSLLDQEVIETRTETVGFIFPLHVLTIPVPVKEFFRRLDLRSSGYVFAIVTRGGTPGVSLDRMLKRRGRRFDARFFLDMPYNDPNKKGWRPATAEEIAEFECEVQTRLDHIQDIIRRRERSLEKDSPPWPVNPLVRLVAPLALTVAERLGLGLSFYVDANCSSCGICQDVCLSRKIGMVEGKPFWREDAKCYRCFACINYCPADAIQLASTRYMKSSTKGQGRYHHPGASVKDIAAQRRTGA